MLYLILLQLALTPAYLFLWIFIHEASHALTSLADGYEVLEFKPYPQKRDGRWFWGFVVSYDSTARFFIMPHIVDVVVFVVAGTCLALFDLSAGWALFVLSAFMIAPLVDFAHGMNGRNEWTDVQRFSKITGIGQVKIKVVANIMALVGILVIGYHISQYFGG